jgi:hypothetical protein
VHGETFGGSDDWSLIRPRHKNLPRGIETRYTVRGVPAPNFAKHLFDPAARFDIDVHVTLTVPCNFIMSFRIKSAGDATSGESNEDCCSIRLPARRSRRATMDRSTITSRGAPARPPGFPALSN